MTHLRHQIGKRFKKDFEDINLLTTDHSLQDNLHLYFIDSEGDLNVMSEDEDLKDALKYRTMKNLDFLPI